MPNPGQQLDPDPSDSYRRRYPVTVLMPVYNGQKYLALAIGSILGQTFTDFEFLIIDDGSSDKSLAILNRFAKADSRIRIVSRSNRGVTPTLNEGLALARGDLLARMDADDIAMPDRLEKQLAYLNTHPDCVMVGSRVQLIDPQGSPIRVICDQLTHEQIDQSLMSHGWPLVHPAVTMRTDIVRRIGGYCEKYRTNQDHDLFLRLAEFGPIANLPGVLLHYRQHLKSISMGNVKKAGDPLAPILTEARRRRGIAQPPESSEPSSANPLKLAHHHSWAWSALAAGNIFTARKHALLALASAPVSRQSWRTLYCALRGK
jgi:glycosyltransferase involved in cell wall biosynthesis